MDELAWAAGFFDGEGCFSVARQAQRSGGPKEYRYLRAAIYQKDIRPLQRFLRAISDEGKHIGLYQSRNVHQIQWQAANAERIYDLLSPYLSEPKREQYAAAKAKIAAA